MLFTIPQIAERFHVSEKTARRWAHEGRLSAIKIGKRLLFREADVLAIMQSPEVRLDHPTELRCPAIA